MAMAVEDALGERLTDGIAVVKILEPGTGFVRTRVRIGGHPIPNQAGYEACLRFWTSLTGLDRRIYSCA